MENFRPFLPCILKKIPAQIWPVSLSQNVAKMRNINRPWPKSNLSWRWSENINMLNLRPFLPCVLKKTPGICKSKCRQNEENQQTMTKSNQFSRWSEYISMSNFRPFIQRDCNKKCEESTWSLMPSQTLSEKVLLKKMPKIQNCNFGQTRYLC